MEPCLTDTRKITKSEGPDHFSIDIRNSRKADTLLLCIMNTPNCTQTIHNLVGHALTFTARLSTTAAGVNNLTLQIALLFLVLDSA